MDNQEVERDALRDCLRNILRFTARQAQTVIDDGYEVAQDMAYWTYDDISSWINHKEKLRTGNQSVHFGDMKKKGLIALAWWITERVRTGEPIDLQQFDDDARRSAIVEARVEKVDNGDDTQASKPEKFKYEDWTEWEKSVYTYLLSVNNSLGVPLAYVIRKDALVTEVDNRTWRVLNNAALDGAVFRSDSQKVLTLLKSLSNGTDAENWMKGKSCGRDAMHALQAHYDGAAEAEKRKEAARSDLKVLFYRNEVSFSFEKYLNRMKRCFDILDKYGVPFYEEEKVKLLLDRIQSSHAEVKTQVSICRASYSADFVQASTYMSKEISRIFPSSNVASASFGKAPKSRPSGNRSISSAGTFKRKGKRQIVKSNNGVDISDTTRYFSKEEWKKLDDDVRKKILDDPERLKKKRAKTGVKVNAVSTSSQSVLSEISRETEDRIIAAVLRASKEQADSDGSTPKVAGPRHGSRVSSSVGSVSSRVTFDRSVHG